MRELEKDNAQNTGAREIALNANTKKDKKKDKTISTAKKTKFKWKYHIILAVGLISMIVATILLSLPTKMDKLLTAWEKAGLSKETVIREISETDLLSKINNKEEYVFVFYGTPDSEDAVKKISIIDTNAEKFKVEVKVYWLDATTIHNTSEDDRNATDFKTEIRKRQEALQDVDLFKIPSFWYYKDGKMVFDTADNEDAEFELIINKAFGEYAENVKK